MNLIIDVGNTLIKLAVFREQKLLELQRVTVTQFEDSVAALFQQFPEIQQGIISSVGSLPEEALASLKNKITLYILSPSLQLPFINAYETPETLGVDRIALVAAASMQYPNEHVLVIDGGSCITYDFIDKENTYKGGAISPGLAMRYKALHTFTAKLPLLQAQMPEQVTGSNTQEAIHSGVVQGVLYEIEGAILAYKEKYAPLTIILTGGDAHFLRDRLKNDIFANSNFLLEGLNYILELNKD